MDESSADAPSDFRSLLSNAFSVLRSHWKSVLQTVQTAFNTYFPSDRRSALIERARSFVRERPLLASFLISHALFSGLPLLLFLVQALSVLFSLAAAVIVGCLSALAFTAVFASAANLVLFPVLLFTGAVGFAVWICAWVAWYGLRWASIVVQENNWATVGRLMEHQERGSGKWGSRAY
ncbi:hypothetical protein VTO42DRAFT_3223 [Malbranchea cinnamomea]